MKLIYPSYHFIKTGHIKTCQICNSKKLHLILDLGHQPLSDTLLTKNMLDDPEVNYPLRMVWCEKCTGVQIDYCVDPKKVFHPNYPYRSGITSDLVDYLNNLSLSIIEKYKLKSEDLVLDVGSNDGTLLKGFKDNGIKVLGVDPVNIAKLANSQGLETIQAWFNIKTSEKIKKKYGLSSIVITNNTFAHIPTIGEFIMAAYNILKKDGVFINETHYLLDVIKDGQFDTIYHEHLRTYSLHSLIKLFKPYDFTITDVQRGTRYGGNIRIYATKGKGKIPSPNVKKLLKEEKDFGLDKLKTYQEFANRVKKSRLDFMEFLIKTKKSGKSIVGDASPARASTLLNYYAVDTTFIPYISEQPTSLKLNRFLPGKHIPIVKNQKLFEQQPDYVIILAWHYANSIMHKLKKRGLKSDFVIPLPDFRIVKNSKV